jgi:hypothetical protein
MPENREAVILIHGLGINQKDFSRDLLMKGLLSVPEDATVTQQRPVTAKGLEGIQLQVDPPGGGEPRLLDIYESFWADLAPPLSQATLKQRFLGGAELLWYWLFSKVWRGSSRRKVLTSSMFLGAVLLMLWYLSTLGMVITAMGQAQATPGNCDYLQVAGLSAQNAATFCELSATKLSEFGGFLQGWKGWLILGFIVGFLPIHRIADIADFGRRYLVDEPTTDADVGMRSKVRGRVRSTLHAAVMSGAYGRVTVVAHSFGAAVAVDILANYKPPAGTVFRLITLGGPLELLAKRAAWMEEEINRCAQQSFVEQWTDFSSHEDWFCTPTPFKADGKRLIHTQLKMEATLRNKLSGQTHSRYLVNEEVLSLILTPPLASGDTRGQEPPKPLPLPARDAPVQQAS